ncbi:MAG: hypoxanthine phosphoribosyltransferase [Actinomycetota bacterium]|nr:hypoxanthine phosphoribosyltransferase [Actinomycetota bacterium]
MRDLGFATEVLSEADLQSRAAELGEAITHDYRDRNPLFVVMLKGSVPFAADLTRKVATDCEVDFLGLNRFGESGRIAIAMDLLTSVFDRHVVIIEDIVDTGLTLNVLRRMMIDRGAASVSTAALLDKARRRVADVPIEYRGFEVGDEFLIGYGLDWEGFYRNMRSIWAVMDIEAFVDNPKILATALHAG